MGLWEDLEAASNSQQSQPDQPLSKVNEFKKQQLDNTKVGKVEQKVGGVINSAITSGKKNRLLSWAVNSALNVMETVGKGISAVTQAVATPLLTMEAMNKYKNKSIAENFRFARKKAKDISMGQALATTVGQQVGALLPDQITPKFMDSDFNVFDDKQRNQAYKNEWIGWLTSGSTDLALAMLGSKGASAAVKTTKTAALGSRTIRSAEEMNTFRNAANEAAAWGARADGTPAPSGLAVLIDDAVKQTDLTKLANNPLVRETSNPYRTAIIMKNIDNHNDMVNYLLAERGDTAAFDRFFNSKPLMADHLDDYGFNKIDPITDFSNIGLDALSPKLTQRYQKLIDAKKAESPRFAYALDDFLNKSKMGIFESYQPGRFSSLEKLELGKNKLKDQAKYGDLKLFGADGNNGWKTKLYQSNIYDRGIRLIAWTGSGRPQGIINISNPRKYEAANDLLSDLNRLQMLRSVDGSEFKRKMVNEYLSALDDTQRAIALGNIEQQVMVKLAKYYGIRGIDDVTGTGDAVNQIKQWHAKISQSRQTIKEYATKHGMIPDENDGSINISNFYSIANEAQTIPMLDFRKLETEVILNANRLMGARAPLSKGQIAGAYATKTSMGVGELLDVANMAFSNLNLLRLAYIPKNSMLDPFARASMALNNLSLLGNIVPGIRHLVYNNSLRAESAKRFIPGSPAAAARRAEKNAQKEMDILGNDLNPAVQAWTKAQTDYDVAQKAFNDARILADKAETALKRGAKTKKKADLEAAKANADYVLYQAQRAFSEADDMLTTTADAVNGIANVMKKHRDVLTEAAKNRAELRKYKYLGQDKEVLEVNGVKYTIDGLADPNIRGASAYMSEVDTATNFVNASMQTQLSKRLRADSQRFVTIKRNEGKPFWNAIAHIANRQVRNELDMPLGMLMRGESDGQVLRWLRSSDGKEYVRRLESRAGHELDNTDLSTWISSTRDSLYSIFPDEQLRKTILDRNVSTDEVEAALRNRPDLIEEIDGPNINLDDLNKWEKGFLGIQTAADLGWKVLSGAETRLVRTPLFLTYTREEMKTLVNAAQRAGINPADSVVNDQMRQIAYRNALARVEQTLYSSRRLTNGMYMARFMMSFPMAFFNSQAVALRLMAKNPMNAYWYSSIANAFDNFEAYQDQDGNTYKSMKDVPPGTPVSVKYPIPFGNKLPKWAKDSLRPYTDKRGGGLKWNPKQMEFMIADPSVSWFGSVEISQLIKDGINVPGGLWTVHGEDVAKALRNTLGDDFYENSVLYGGYPQEGTNVVLTAANAILPSYLRSAFNAVGIFKDGRFADDVNTMYKVAYAEWDRNGRVGSPPDYAKAAKAAGNMSFIKAVTQFVAPISTTFDPVTRAAMQYYSDSVKANNGDFRKAEQQMVDEWGVDSLAFIGSSNKNIAGVAANESDIKMLRNNKELLISVGRYDPKLAAMLSTGYGELTDKYSTEVAAIYKNMNFPGGYNAIISQSKNSEEMRKTVEARRGWYEYQKATEWRDAMMYQYGIKTPSEARYTSSGIGSGFNEMVDNISKVFPGWAEVRDNNRNDFWRVTVPAIKQVTSNTAWMKHANKNTNKWNEIAYWIDQVSAWKTNYDMIGNSANRKQDARAQLAQFHYDFLQVASEDFATFSSRWLESMPQLTESLAVQ